jgi:hypothetical protein
MAAGTSHQTQRKNVTCCMALDEKNYAYEDTQRFQYDARVIDVQRPLWGLVAYVVELSPTKRVDYARS